MPEPISANVPASPNISYDPEEGQVCAPNRSQAPSLVASATASEPLPRGVSKLIRALPPPPSTLPAVSPPGLLRLGNFPAGGLQLESMTVLVNPGIYNGEEREGMSLGGQVKALGSELTRGAIKSVTVGSSEGGVIGGSIGVRDADGDTELCAKVTYGPIAVGVCVETPF